MAPAGARVSIEALFNHRAIVYRGTETRDELQDVVTTWAALTAPNGLNCRPNQDWSGSLQDHGPGEQQGAMRQWFLHKDFDVRQRDVVSVVSGPESPVTLKVESVTPCTDPLEVHHYEVNVSVWHGSLVEDEVTS